MANGHGGKRLGSGAKAGVQRAATIKAHEAIALAFDKIGGVEALTVWAKANPDSFYERVWPKIVPLQIGGAEDLPPISHLAKIALVGPGAV